MVAGLLRSTLTHICESSWFAPLTASMRYCASATAFTAAACIATIARMPSEKMRMPISASSSAMPD